MVGSPKIEADNNKLYNINIWQRKSGVEQRESEPIREQNQSEAGAKTTLDDALEFGPRF